MEDILYAAYSETNQLHSPKDILRRGNIVKYMENPDRVKYFLSALKDRKYKIISPRSFDIDAILAIHSAGYIDFLRDAHPRWRQAFADGKASDEVVAHTFAVRYPSVCPTSIQGQVGYYLAGSSVPITKGTFAAAISSAHCALEAAARLCEGETEAYALCRPPGHHAYRDLAGGFCYLNNAAIAAQALLPHHERVAIFDFDVHHGNGTQSIFYDRNDVHFVSVHADPNDVFPFYSGHPNETGEGRGQGFNLNLPVPAGSGDEAYLEAVRRGILSVRESGATALVVSAGFDAFKGDPSVDMNVSTDGFRQIGRLLGQLRLSTAIIQEGGYLVEELGLNLGAFLDGFSAER